MLEFTYSQVESLNETEAYVYNYVVKNTKKVLNESIRELANDTHVSTATIMHFCKKMGCEGFTELKYRLKESEEMQETKEDNVADQFGFFIEKIKSSDYLDSIHRAAEIIKQSDLILTLGIGTTGDFAKYTSRLLSGVGYCCYGVDGAAYPVQRVAEGHQEVIIAFYERIQKKLLFEEIYRYKNKNYMIIMFSNNNVGSMEHLCDEVIHVSDGSVMLGKIHSGIPMLYAIEKLAYELTK
ncbi:MAG: MurR/RpiR family transcriptional regulator [Catenibacterium mitsuokai]|nr:MurR/RpiR family transcriptional regulator [Catenibacterium mitsuokai]MEE0081308.1 MurR/RpiR family transcriptional regulator [Catenibacterium mitsuokai]